MSRPFLIALVCIGAFCLTTDTHASSNVLEVRVNYIRSPASTETRNHFVMSCGTDADCTVRGALSYFFNPNFDCMVYSHPPAMCDSPTIPGYECKVQTRVPRNLVEALAPAARADLKAVLKPFKEFDPVYSLPPYGFIPGWEVKIRLDSGPLWLLNRLLNTSRAGSEGAWNVRQSGRWAVQASDRFDRAFKALLEPIFKSVKGGCPTR
jgi:hypothetical protein